MALTPGARLGPYEILSLLGAGGMGEVYKARDTTLDRDVAIKILPEAFLLDPERVARFQREAKTLASLNHPNIGSIHGLEESGGVVALVMELVPGEDLSQRIARGAIPLDEALPLAKQIAEALETAHEQGIVHRDLKPANIKVRHDGTVKVLDFGLAKAADPAAGSGPNVSMSPTITTPAMTRAGMILGTAAYMSPEQAKGRPADKRADIWAFGVLFYEMLTGTSLFTGESVAETLGLIFSREPDLLALPAATPARVRTLIARCLVKDPRQRLRDIGDARLELEDARSTPGAAVPAPPRAGWRMLPWGVAIAAVLLAGWVLWTRTAIERPAPQVTQLDIGFPRNVEPYTPSGTAISPDGRVLAMIGVRDGVRRVFIRRFDRAEPIELADIGGANAVGFSHDGGSVAITVGQSITRVSLSDLQRKVVTSGVDQTSEIEWSPSGIIFGRDGALWIVSPDGGAPRALTILDAARHEVLHSNPVLLPGGRIMLFGSQTTEPGEERIEAMAIDGGPRSVVVERAATPTWSSTGHLLFARDGAMLAAPLDPDTGKLRGAAVPVMPAGAVEGDQGVSLSSTGTLVYLPAGFTDRYVVSVGRDGAALNLDLPAGRYGNPRISPDGRRLSVEIATSVIEVLDLARGTRARLTAAAKNTNFSTWTSDGARLVFRRFNTPFWAATDGSGDAGPVPGATINDYPSSPGPDPDSVILLRIRPVTSGDVFLVSIKGAFEPKPLVATPAYDGGAQLSPDGRWLVYQSNASGQAEIYVRRYPAMDRQWQVSEGGGLQARWSRNNREIYYRSGQRMTAVAFDASGLEPVFGRPTGLFADDYDFGAGASVANYDVTPDGRFLMIRRGANGGNLRAVVNWTEELKQILAAGGVR